MAAHTEPTSIQGGEKKTMPQEEQLRSKQLDSDVQHAAAFPQHSGSAETRNPSGSRLPLPFPQRFQKQQQDGQFRKFLDVLKQLQINIPLVEALEHMPSYAKFMKDLVTKKRRLGEFETVALTEECSAILALCDLGASINLMPMSIFKRLGIGEARATTVSLQLADRSIATPEGKIEDVLVRVDKFIFPADFIILDYEADREVPIILERPFLATGRTLIDVQKGELTLRVQDEQVTFNVLKAMRFPSEMEECSTISVIDSLVAETLKHDNFESNVEGGVEQVEWVGDM
ncbi:uncharacterized protein LOC112090696 [Morus notabilis]|uniref:uncharacterized protein LOC112090696 n=1 Tax=Morus notabilis TaxID=981085 RepID=UPI000CED4E47|nr:uncharacterized protein LOC112090696 [Morus notabilis]